MEKYNIIATCNMGLEAVLKRECMDLGFSNIKSENGRIIFQGGPLEIAKANVHLRTCERVLVEVNSFSCFSFEELYQGVKNINWENFIDEDSNFVVNGRSKNSKLFSIRDCQSISEKAIVDKLKAHYKKDWFSKTGARMDIEVSLDKDVASITIDTSGQGLHKRGYRARNFKAPISETIAAALVLLSYWNKNRILVDPFCGSGTIVIEAAMIGKNIAPGLTRKFAGENFKFIGQDFFKTVKKDAYAMIDYKSNLTIYASDIERKAIEIAKENAEILGLEDDINFFQKDIFDLDLGGDFGVVITNPPYGIRLEEKQRVSELEAELGNLYRHLKNWSFYIITANEDFQENFKQKAKRNRKLYNGRLRTYYYQYPGPKPNDSRG